MNERYDFLTAEIRRMRTDCDGHAYDIGLHLLEIAGGLYREGGFDTLAEYVNEAVTLEERQARKAMRIARNYGRETAARLGVERCDLYLSYIELTPEDDRPADIDRATVLVDGTRVPVSTATVDQIQSAIRALRGRPETTPEAQAAAAALEGAWPGARVSASRDRVTMSVPATGLCGFLAAARTALNCS